MADTPTNVNVLSLFGSIGLDSTEFNKGLDEAARKMQEFGQTLTNSVTNATTGANTALNGVTTTATTGATAINGITDAADAAGQAIVELGENTESTTTIIDGARRTVDNLGEEIDETTKSEQDYNEETQDAKKKTDDFGGSMEKTTEKAGKLQAALSKGVSIAVKAIGAAMAAAATAATALVKQSVDAYGSYEQLVGGVQTLFSNLEGTVSAAPTVLENAANAYKTAGMSANQYMEAVTSFSAALVAGLEGDYQRAAEVSDMAIRDMSDNANKMGTAMQSIQNAYQGFARGNYTMLDNLRLGYGGTKAEMERLLKDAEEFSGIEYDMSNLADVYNAIHVIQEQMGITGTTAKEAADTITGSFGSLGAAWQNLVTGFADKDANLSELIDNVVQAAEGSFGHIIPIAEQAVIGIGNFVEEIAPVIAEKLPDVVNEILPGILTTADQVVNTLVTALPGMLQSVVDVVPQVITDVTTTAINMLPNLVDLAKNAIVTLAKGLTDSAPALITAAVGAVSEIAHTLTDPATLKEIQHTAWDLLVSLADGIAENLPVIVDAAADIMLNMVEYFTDPENLEYMITSALHIVGALAEGLVKAIPKIITAVASIPGKIIDTLMSADWEETGGMIVEGLTEGLKISWTLFDGAIEAGLTAVDALFGSHLTEWYNDIQTFSETAGRALYDALNPNAGEAGWTYEDSLNRLAEWLPKVEDEAEDAAKAIYLPTEALRQMQGEEAKAISELPKIFNELEQSAADSVNGTLKYGIVKTVGEALDDAQKEADALAKEVYNAAKEDADRQTTRLKLSYDEQLKLWNDIKDQFVEGSEQYEKALDEIYKIQDKKRSDEEKALDKYNKELEKKQKEQATQAKKNADNLAKAEKSALNERTKAYTAFEKQVEKISDNIKDIENDYADTLKKRSEDIYNSFGLFEKVPERILYSGVDLTNNLQEQIDRMEKFYGDIATLSQRGVSDALVQEIQGMGVKAIDQLDALLDLSDDELDKYDELFTRKHDLAADVAEGQLTGAKAQMEQDIQSELDKLAESGKETGEQWGLDFTTGIVAGLKAGLMNLDIGATLLLSNAKNALLEGLETSALADGSYQTTSAAQRAQTSSSKDSETSKTSTKAGDIVVNVNGVQFQNVAELALAISKEIAFQIDRGAAGYAGA